MTDETREVNERSCSGCSELREIVYADAADRGYCAACTEALLIDSAWAKQVLAMTVPLDVGDRVEARTAGVIFDGVGHVTAVHFDLEHGGTPVWPMFRVVIDEPANELSPSEALYTEVCLRKILGAETPR